ncbi:hypothetical protein JCM18899A_08390 [Nocardioides sp. AN3]
MSDNEALSAREWEAALERLEVLLNRAERMGTTFDPDDVELSLPDSVTTIPRYLLDRAQALVERRHLLIRWEAEATDAPPEDDAGLVSAGTWEPSAARGGTLHDRVGHLITGPREPVTFDLFSGATDSAES